MPNNSLTISENTELAPLTTIQLGGQARYYASCTSLDQIREALAFAEQHQLKIHILGGGSNTVFSDEGFDGLIIKNDMRGIQFTDEEDAVTITAQAGELLDDLVAECTKRRLGGLECLSGIPGLVGATPIQNVGAYGQTVSQTIDSVITLDRHSQQKKVFTNEQCLFSYRSSRFKYEDKDRYIITAVAFKLAKHGQPNIEHPDLIKQLGGDREVARLNTDNQALQKVRSAVLAVRSSKSMVIDSDDPHSRSCGSFFINPVLTESQLAQLQQRVGKITVPSYQAGGGHTIPAAWLIEQTGFAKGYQQNHIGISQKHILALVNYGGTTKELLALAEKIQAKVMNAFGLMLELEPVLV